MRICNATCGYLEKDATTTESSLGPLLYYCQAQTKGDEHCQKRVASIYSQTSQACSKPCATSFTCIMPFTRGLWAVYVCKLVRLASALDFTMMHMAQACYAKLHYYSQSHTQTLPQRPSSQFGMQLCKANQTSLMLDERILDSCCILSFSNC